MFLFLKVYIPGFQARDLQPFAHCRSTFWEEVRINWKINSAVFGCVIPPPPKKKPRIFPFSPILDLKEIVHIFFGFLSYITGNPCFIGIEV